MLSPGTRLGPYEVSALIGEGGMGQVFKARDTRLDRAVAIKMLPAALAADPTRRERFEREARNVSRLEHPNICPLYDIGEHEGHLYLVMQYLDGETLAEQLTRGPLSIKHALDYGVQIAEALAAAHRAEIVHRDLKPGNVMVTRTGVRLLDFGLARTVTATANTRTMAGDRTGLRGALTTEGTILGTLSYMAPEQIDGGQVDTRADVFAFGAVLFEMVTGLKAFDGESPARVMSAILRDEPARVSSIVPVTPAALEALIHACLAKDPQERWQNIADVARQLRHLRDMMSSGKSGLLNASAVLPAPVITTTSRRPWLLGAAALAVIAALAFAAGRLNTTPEEHVPVSVHAAILPPAGMYLTNTLALSPDGQRLAFVAADATGQRQLWVRPLAAPDAHAVAGTQDASDPFWSPDSAHIAFFANRQLKRVAASGGSVTVVTDTGNGAGGSWNRDGVIVFGRLDGPLMRVPAGGGRAEPIAPFDAALGETHHLYPAFLPDGDAFVFYVNSRERGLYVASLDGSGKTRLFDPDPALPAGAAPTPGVYAEGHLLYVRDRVLMARRFDPGSRTATSEPITVAETVDYDPPGQAAFTIANGVLVLRARAHRPIAEVAWLDRSGQAAGAIASPPGTFRTTALSPDGRTLAIDRRDPQGLPSVWFVDVATGASSRLTAAYWASDPIWSQDGQMLAYSVAVDSPPNLVIRADRGRGAERRLTNNGNEQQYANSFTPDGKLLVFHAITATTGTDLYVVDLTQESATPQRLLQTRANEHSGRVSPDGRWMAYVSDDSGQPEVYIARFPELQGAVRVSSGGGSRPWWRRDGKELFFLAPGGRMMALAIATTNAAINPGAPTELFRSVFYGDVYAPDPTGQRFLTARPTASSDIVPLEIITAPFR